jgi:hypothetical protein
VRPAILITFALLFAISIPPSVFFFTQLKKRMRALALLSALGSGLGAATFIALLLEEFWGIITAVMFGLSTVCLTGGVSIMFLTTFEPLKLIGHINRRFKRFEVRHIFVLQTTVLPILLFVLWIPPYVAARNGDWVTYNLWSVGFLWALALTFMLFICIPYVFMFGVFERTIKSLYEPHEVQIDNSSEAKRQRMRMENLVKLMRTLKNNTIITGTMNFLPAIYCTVFVVIFNQLPLNVLMFVLVVNGLVVIPMANNAFLLRVYLNHQDAKKSSNALDTNNNVDIDHPASNNKASAPALSSDNNASPSKSNTAAS